MNSDNSHDPEKVDRYWTAWFNLNDFHFHKYQLTQFANLRCKEHINELCKALGLSPGSAWLHLLVLCYMGLNATGKISTQITKTVPI